VFEFPLTKSLRMRLNPSHRRLRLREKVMKMKRSQVS